jgi:hypothetical protein
MPSNNPNMCEHANEVPHVCRCNHDCYCRTRTCKPDPNHRDTEPEPKSAWDRLLEPEEDEVELRTLVAGATQELEAKKQAFAQTGLFVVRLWDMFDGWIDISGPITQTEAARIWNERTTNGTRKTKYEDGDYYRIFPANTRMLMTPEFLGR